MTRRVVTFDRTLARAVLVGLLCMATSCGRVNLYRGPARADAAVAARTPDAAVRPHPRRPSALRRLIDHVPRRATWFVGLGRPAALVHGAKRFWNLLADIPDLAAPMALVAQRFGKVMGTFSPPATLWSDLGIDPGGGAVLAGVAAAPNRRSGTLALVFTTTPQRLLRRLVGPAGVPAGATARAALEGVGSWWCGPVSVGVACASSRALVVEAMAQAATPSSRTLWARLPDPRWQSVDVVCGWRKKAGKSISTAIGRFTSWGIQAQMWLRTGELARWLGWLGPGGSLRPRSADAVATVWLSLDSARVSTLVGLVPADAIQTADPASPPPTALLNQCTGEAMLMVGPDGWRIRAARKAAGVGIGRPLRWKVSGWPIWARATAESLLVASTAAGTRTPTATTPRGGTHRALAALVSRPASAAMVVPLMDPLELLTAADRARLVAALAGLPAGERAFVGLLRGVLTLVGEAGVSVTKTPEGAVVRISVVTPASGSVAWRRDFDRLWRAKWQGGGFFDRPALARVAARHRGTPLARLARSVTGLRLGAVWSRWLGDTLLRLVRRLSGPELSCAVLAARLVRCREAFARLRSPRRWREMQSVELPAHRRRLRRALLDLARREGESLGAHCDRLVGRLENAREVRACLAANGCRKFARCLVDAFKPKK